MSANATTGRQAAVARRMDGMDHQDLSHTLWAMATLTRPVRPDAAWMALFHRRTLEILPSFSAQSVANLVWAAAKLALPPPPPLLAALHAHLQVRATTAPARSASCR
jgi:hypothetical protein